MVGSTGACTCACAALASSARVPAARRAPSA